MWLKQLPAYHNPRSKILRVVMKMNILIGIDCCVPSMPLSCHINGQWYIFNVATLSKYGFNQCLVHIGSDSIHMGTAMYRQVFKSHLLLCQFRRFDCLAFKLESNFLSFFLKVIRLKAKILWPLIVGQNFAPDPISPAAPPRAAVQLPKFGTPMLHRGPRMKPRQEAELDSQWWKFPLSEQKALAMRVFLLPLNDWMLFVRKRFYFLK